MASTGQKQRANSKRGQLRRPNLTRFYNRKIADMHPGMYEWRVLLVRAEAPASERITSLSPKTTFVDWNDEGDTFAGSLTLRRLWRLKPNSVPVKEGDGVRLQFKWAGSWQTLWTLWVQGEPEVNLGSGEVTCELGDELYPLKKNERDWEFKKTKKGAKRKGWTADEVARSVGKTEHVRIGKLAQGTERFELKKLKKKSGLEVIRQAYAKESKKTGRKFIVRMRDGKLEVLPLRRPGTLYVIHGIEQEASTSGKAKQERPVTVIEAKGRLKGKNGKDGKLKLTVARPNAVRRFGRVVKEQDYGRVDSEDDLRTQAKRDLAKELEVTRTAVLTLPGVPFLEKGSTLRWIIDEPGWTGKTKLAKRPRDKSYVFVTSASHSLTPNSYTTTVSVSQEDIYYADAKKRDEEARDEKHQERKGRDKTKAKKGEGESESEEEEGG